jgi:hypothetical protein
MPNTMPNVMTDTMPNVIPPEQLKLQQTMELSQNMNFEIQNTIQNVNEQSKNFILNLTKH